MEINKPKYFTPPKSKIPTPETYNGSIRILRPNPVSYFTNYEIAFDNERWDVRCQMPNLNPVISRTTNFLNVGFEPISVEFYAALDCTGQELFAWIDEIEQYRNLLIPVIPKKTLLFLKHTNRGTARFITYGAMLNNITLNENAEQRFNIDPIIECDVYFDHYELL